MTVSSARARTAAAALSTAIALTSSLLIGTPSAQAAALKDVPDGCRTGFQVFTPSTGQVGWVVQPEGKDFTYEAEVKPGLSPVAATDVITPWDGKSMQGEFRDQFFGTFMVGHKGQAKFRSASRFSGTATKTVAVPGMPSGLRILAASGGVRTIADTYAHQVFLYAVDSRGRLPRLPIDWKKNNRTPKIGKAKVLPGKFGDLTTLDYSTSAGEPRDGRLYSPADDRLVGTTKFGQLVEITVTRKGTLKATRKVLAARGFKDIKGISITPCQGGGDWIAYSMSRSDGYIYTYVDPKGTDHAWKKIETYRYAKTLPAKHRLI